MTKFLPKPEVILTHESDLDGLVSGLLLQRLARKLFGVEVPLEAYHNQNWRQRSLTEKSAWVCDLTFETRLDRENWIVIDHHAVDLAPQCALLIHDVEKSAGLLCYELCLQQGLGTPKLDRLVHLNNVADLFLVDDPDFTLATDYANLVKVYQFWNLCTLIEGGLEQLMDHPLLAVMEVKRRVEDPLGLAWSRKNVREISPSIGLVDTVVGNTNAIVHHLLQERATPHNVLLTLFRRGNGQYVVSLRSQNGEAIKVAERLQGGGHANASGATLPRSVQSFDDAIQYLRHVLNPPPPRNAPFNSLGNLISALDLKV